MTTTPDAPQSTPVGFLTADDEMSLADSRAQQSADSIPDTLEVHGDSMTLVQGELGKWRRPVQLTLAGLALGIIVSLGISILLRRGKEEV